MPKKISIHIDGDKVQIETEGYPAMTCLEELKKLNFPFAVESQTDMPSRGVLVGQKAKTAA